MKVKPRFLIQLGILWIILGAFLSAPYWLSALRTMATTQTAATPDTSAPVNTDKPRLSGTPARIAFPGLSIDKALLPGTYDEKSRAWSLADYEAQYATVTPEPNNQTGNTFIYGHNNMNVFGKLLDATPGIEAIITTTNGHTFRYRLETITDVQPNDLSFLADHKSPILTVQTCSGLWSESRRMFVFTFVEAT